MRARLFPQKWDAYPKAPLSGELSAKQTERLSLSGTTSPSRRFAEPPPLEGEALECARAKAPLVKGSWPEGPEGLARRSEKAPLSGELAAEG